MQDTKMILHYLSLFALLLKCFMFTSFYKYFHNVHFLYQFRPEKPIPPSSCFDWCQVRVRTGFQPVRTLDKYTLVY